MISQVTLQTNQIHHRHMLLGLGPYKTLVIVPLGLLYQDIILGILTCVWHFILTKTKLWQEIWQKKYYWPLKTNCFKKGLHIFIWLQIDKYLITIYEPHV